MLERGLVSLVERAIERGVGGKERRWKIRVEEGQLHLSVIHYMSNTAAPQHKTALATVLDREAD